MGKNLRGRELGRELSQRKDGKYSVRFISVTGKRIERFANIVFLNRND